MASHAKMGITEPLPSCLLSSPACSSKIFLLQAQRARVPRIKFIGDFVCGRWEESLEEAYEGWGGQGTELSSGSGGGSKAPAQGTKRRKKVTNLRGLFPQPGVVYPIVPTGHMRLPRPQPRPKEEHGGGGSGLFNTIAPSSPASPSSWSFSSSYEDDFGNSGQEKETLGGGALRESARRRVSFVVQARVSARTRARDDAGFEAERNINAEVSVSYCSWAGGLVVVSQSDPARSRAYAPCVACQDGVRGARRTPCSADQKPKQPASSAAATEQQQRQQYSCVAQTNATDRCLEAPVYPSRAVVYCACT